MSEYVRTRGGEVTHVSDCSTLFRGGVLTATATPWRWAEGKTPAAIIGELLDLNIAQYVRFCKRCLGQVERERAAKAAGP